MVQDMCWGRDAIECADTSASAPRVAHVLEPALDEGGVAPEQT